jgi:outer membrane phospholipase A
LGGVWSGVRADIILSSPEPAVTAGAALALDLTILNDTAEPMTVELPDPVHARLEAAALVATLEFAPERSGPLKVAPGAFVRVRLTGRLPTGVEGTMTLTPTGIAANVIVLQAGAQPSAQSLAQRPAAEHDPGDILPGWQADASGESPGPGTTLVDKPPPLALYTYEPMYVLVGGDDGLNAKFQLSLRFRLFDGRGRLASRLPWIDDLYLSFSQTSLWDLSELSKPFRDSSYRPRLFFFDPALTSFLDGRLHVGVEGGVGHESNGKEGTESRSFNMLYLRPVLSLGDPEGFRMYAAPLIHNYIADGENPDLKDYRGYVDWLFGIGSKGGLDVWTTLRKGRRSDFGSVELSVSYPLSKLSGGDLTGWLMLQYFGGYGESLLDYDRKLDSQLRLGIAIAL